jgi:alpha-N-arabinofuranosidase
LIDEHFYCDPHWLMANVHRFDPKNYPRDKPRAAKIFLGEVSAVQDSLGAALGEAAFLLGAEKNSDKVVMACYAPLFANANHKNWPSNAIYFDSHRVYMTPSGYAQKMLAQNTGDVNLAVGGLKGLLDSTVFVGATLQERSGDIIVKIVNANPAARNIAIELPGLSAAPRAALVTVLSAADKNAGNSFEKPANVAPRAKTIEAIGQPLSCTLEPNSFTVVRLTRKAHP